MQRRKERRPARWPLVLILCCVLLIAAVAVTYVGLRRTQAAFVGGHFISRVELNNRMRHAQFVYDLQVGSAEVDPEFASRSRQVILNHLIAEHLLLREQEQRQISIDEADAENYVEEVLHWLTEGYFHGSEELLVTALAGYDLELEWLQGYLADTLVLYQLRQQLTDSIVITEAQMREYYDQNKTQFDIPAMIRVRHILVSSAEEAEQVRRLLLSGGDTAQLARELSLDLSTRDLGGDLNWRARGQLLAEIEDAAWELSQVGEISEVIVTHLGYHVIRLEGKRSAQERIYAEVSEVVKEVLFEIEEARIWDDYLAQVQSKKRVYFFGP